MRRVPLLLLLLVLAACRRPPESPFGDDAAYEDASDRTVVTLLTENGGRVDWSRAHGRLAFDRLGEDGWFDVWTMEADGSDPRCVTCATPGLPARNVGQPAWHPSGDWIVVQAEKAESDARPFASHPGRGTRNDLWIVRANGSEAFALTDVPNEAGHGVLHPHLHDDRLTWSQMVGGIEVSRDGLLGIWELRIAALVMEPTPHLEDERSTDLGHEGFFENHGLSEDGTRWIFSANLDPDEPPGQLNDIYVIDVESLDGLERLTTAGYNEHASFLPGSDRFVWMSNAGNRDRGTDWWMAGLDGSEPTRLTRLEDVDGTAVAADLSVASDGRSFVGYVQDGVGGQAGRIVHVALP